MLQITTAWIRLTKPELEKFFNRTVHVTHMPLPSKNSKRRYTLVKVDRKTRYKKNGGIFGRNFTVEWMFIFEWFMLMYAFQFT